MPIPKSVEEAGRLADELHAKVYPTQDPKTNAAASPAPAQQPTPVPDPAAQSAPPVEDAAYWKSRYQVVEGKYNAEVPRLAEQVRHGKEAHDKLEAQVQELKKAPTPAPAPVAVPADLVEKYGEEFLADMRKIIPPQVAPAANPDLATKADIEELRKRDVQRGKKEFFSDLDGRAPKWRELNTHAGFLDWLAGVDDFSGRTRQDLFDDAYTSFDVNRVANFFNTFSGTQRQSGAEPTSAPPPPLDHQLTPSQNRTESPPAGKKIWTAQEVEKFYLDARKGVYRGKEGEAAFARIEQDIFTAKREGRLR